MEPSTLDVITASGTSSARKGGASSGTATKNADDKFGKTFSEIGKKYGSDKSQADSAAAEGGTVEEGGGEMTEKVQTRPAGAVSDLRDFRLNQQAGELTDAASDFDTELTGSIESEPSTDLTEKLSPDLAEKIGTIVKNASGRTGGVAEGEETTSSSKSSLKSAIEVLAAIAVKGGTSRTEETSKGETEEAASVDDQEVDGVTTAETKTEPAMLTATAAAESDTGSVDQLLSMLSVPQQAENAALAGGMDGLARAAGTKTDKDTSRLVSAAEGKMSDMPAATDNDVDQSFLFARADGTGRNVEMAVSTKNQEAVFKDPAAEPKGAIENVTVLDARRYIGIAPNANTFALTEAISQDPALTETLKTTSVSTASQLPGETSKVVNTLKIQMTPENLGTIEATLRLQGNELTVDVRVESGEAYRQLKNDHNAIVSALRSHGLAVDQVNIQFSAPSDRSGGQQGQSDAQSQNFSQQARDGAQQGGARQQGDDARQQNNTQEGWSRNVATKEDAVETVAAQRSASGDVYL